MTSDVLHIFLHVPKTAGTTFKLHVQGSFRPGEYLLLYQDREPAFNAPGGVERYLKALPERRRDAIKVLFGHKVYRGIHELFPGREARYITFLRDPIRQTISRYNFGLTTLGSLNRLRNRKFERELAPDGRIATLEQWLAANERHQNFTFRYLYSHFFDLPHDEVVVNEENLEKILAVLGRFYFVGLVENRDDQLFLYHELGIRRFFPPQRVSRRHAGAEDPAERTRLVVETHRFDQRIYDFAAELNRRFKSGCAGFEAAVEAARAQREAARHASALSRLPTLVSQRLNQVSLGTRILLSKTVRAVLGRPTTGS